MGAERCLPIRGRRCWAPGVNADILQMLGPRHIHRPYLRDLVQCMWRDHLQERLPDVRGMCNKRSQAELPESTAQDESPLPACVHSKISASPLQVNFMLWELSPQFMSIDCEYWPDTLEGTAWHRFSFTKTRPGRCRTPRSSTLAHQRQESVGISELGWPRS